MEQASKRSRLTFYHTSPSRYSSSGRVRRNAKEKTPLSAIAKTRLLERIAINVNQLNAPETDGSGPYRKTDNLIITFINF